MSAKCLFLALLARISAMASAQGGPPLLTDDTETVAPGKWEINLAWQTEHVPGSWRHEGPIFDFNRGVTDRCHVNFEVPWVSVSEGGQTLGGIGNGGVGSKIRFVDGGRGRPAISIHPAVGFRLSSRSVRLGISDSATIWTLPVAFQWDVDGLGINAEIGTTFALGSAPGWVGGLAFGRTFSGTEFLGEIHGEGVGATGESVWALQLGLRRDLCPSSTLLLAFGRSFANHGAEPIQWMSYLALQFKF